MFKKFYFQVFKVSYETPATNVTFSHYGNATFLTERQGVDTICRWNRNTGYRYCIFKIEDSNGDGEVTSSGQVI